MNYTRWQFSTALVMAGGSLFTLGILLLLVKLLVALAWYASGAIALGGLALVAIGWLLGGGRGLRR